MRAWFALPLVLGFTACTGNATPTPPPGPDPTASAKAAQKLCYVFQHVGVDCRASQDLVEVGDDTFKVDGVITHQVDLPGGAARNVAFEAHRGPVTLAHPVEILGKGTSPDDALDRAAQEWAALAGTAIVDAVRDTGRSEAVVAALKAGKRAPADAEATPALAVGPFHAYPGIPDIRGAMSGGPRVDHQELLGVLLSELTDLDPGTPHTLSFSLKNPGSPQCDKAELDGERKDGVCNIIGAFAWPTPVQPYTVRQVYVLKPGPVPTPPAPPAATDTDASAGPK